MKQTREHVIPKWIRKVPAVKDAVMPLNSGKPRVSRREIRLPGTNTIIAEPSVSRSKAQHAMYATVSVCGSCNGGWMSELEQQAIPLLTPPINGSTLILDGEARQLLARWACKVAAVYELDQPHSARMSAAQRRDVMKGRPSRATRVYVARFHDLTDMMLLHTSRDITVAKNGNYVPIASATSTVVTLGHVCILVHSIWPAAWNEELWALHSPLGEEWLKAWPATSDFPLVLHDDARGVTREEASLAAGMGPNYE